MIFYEVQMVVCFHGNNCCCSTWRYDVHLPFLVPARRKHAMHIISEIILGKL